MHTKNHLFIVGKEANKNTVFLLILDWLVCLTNVLPKSVNNSAVAQLHRLSFLSVINNKVKSKQLKFAYSKLGSVSSYMFAIASFSLKKDFSFVQSLFSMWIVKGFS